MKRSELRMDKPKIHSYCESSPWSGKMFEDDELNIKILNSLTRTWESKITTIKESKDLATIYDDGSSHQ